MREMNIHQSSRAVPGLCQLAHQQAKPLMLNVPERLSGFLQGLRKSIWIMLILKGGMTCIGPLLIVKAPTQV